MRNVSSDLFLTSNRGYKTPESTPATRLGALFRPKKRPQDPEIAPFILATPCCSKQNCGSTPPSHTTPCCPRQTCGSTPPSLPEDDVLFQAGGADVVHNVRVDGAERIRVDHIPASPCGWRVLRNREQDAATAPVVQIHETSDGRARADRAILALFHDNERVGIGREAIGDRESLDEQRSLGKPRGRFRGHEVPRRIASVQTRREFHDARNVRAAGDPAGRVELGHACFADARRGRLRTRHLLCDLNFHRIQYRGLDGIGRAIRRRRTGRAEDGCDGRVSGHYDQKMAEREREREREREKNRTPTLSAS